MDDGAERSVTTCAELYQPGMVNPALLGSIIWLLIWKNKNKNKNQGKGTLQSLSSLKGRIRKQTISLEQLSKQNLQQRRPANMLAYSGRG